MSIQVACQCGQRFAAKDELAGKTVKCPKCGSALKIPTPGAPPPGFGRPAAPAPPPPRSAPPADDGGDFGLAPPSGPSASSYAAQTYGVPGAGGSYGGGQTPYAPGPAQPYGPGPAAPGAGAGGVSWLGTGGASSGGGGLGDLFDEAGMAAPRYSGPSCPGCAAPMRPDAIICVQCGYNLKLGRRMETIAGPDTGAAPTHGGEAANLMAKAHQEVALAPPAEGAGDYGEGASAYVLGCGMVVAVAMIVGMGAATMYIFDRFIVSELGPTKMVIVSGQVCVVIGWLWMTILAFLENTTHGVLLLLFGNCCCVCPIYGFMKMDTMMWPLIIWMCGFLMQVAGGIVEGASS